MSSDPSKRSQCRLILEALSRYDEVTAITALQRFGCFRLAARINDLREQGYSITTETEKTSTGKRIARYWLDFV